MRRKGKTGAFSLVELLVAISILGVLMSLGMTELRDVRERAKGIQCVSNLRGMGTALQIYAAENHSLLPSLTPDNVEVASGADGRGALDIRFELAAYDTALWSVTCPSDPLSRNNLDPGNPTFISYIYLAPSGRDLAEEMSPSCIVRDGGYHHGHAPRWKSNLLYTDQHVEMQTW